MDAQSDYLERLRSTGGKRSTKRDLIVSVFLRQDGHLSADDLFGLMRQEDQKISRATVYRTLQWMVDAGIARKVDFGMAAFALSIPTVTPGTSIWFASPATVRRSF